MRLRRPDLWPEAAWLALGALLRLAWPKDFLFKLDEARNLEFSLAISRGGEWVTHAWLTSVGLPAGPVTAYMLAAVTRFTTDPLVANLVVVFANIAALAVAVPVYRRLLPDREDARAALALHATSPMAIWFSRKIWDQCLLAVFTVPALLIAAVAIERRTWTIALLPPLLALAAQTHHSGLFFAAVLLGVLLWRPATIAWRPFLAGIAVAAMLSAPYAIDVVRAVTSSEGFHLRSMSRYPDVDVVTNLLLDASGHNILDAAGRDLVPLLWWPFRPIGLLVILVGFPFYVCLIAGYVCVLRRGAGGGVLTSGMRRLGIGLGIGLPLLYLALRVRGVPHYFLPIFPILFALMVVGARRIGNPPTAVRRLLAPPIGALVAINVATWILFATYIHAHWGGESYGLPYGRLLAACRAVTAAASDRGLGAREAPFRLQVDTWRERGLLPKQYEYVLTRVLGAHVAAPATPQEADLVLEIRWPRGGAVKTTPYTIREVP